MAIYRPPKSRWPLAIAIGAAALVIGLIVGLVAGRDEADPAEGTGEIASTLLAAAGSAEVAGIEYDEAVEDGEIVNPTEYDASKQALASSRSHYEEVRAALSEVAPGRVSQIDDAYDAVQRLIEQTADPTEVNAALEELDEALKGETS